MMIEMVIIKNCSRFWGHNGDKEFMSILLKMMAFFKGKFNKADRSPKDRRIK